MKECVLSWTNVAQCQVIMIIIDTAVTPPGARERRLGRTFDSVWSVAWRGLYRGRHSLQRPARGQQVPSEANPKVRNHGEGPY